MRMSQPEFRVKLKAKYGNVPEPIIKYNYDRYTWMKGVKPIRKKKTRKKVGREANWVKLDIKEFL